jgi:hypothetical protein
MKPRSLFLALTIAGLAACVPPELSITYTDPVDDEVLNVPPGDDTIHIQCKLEGEHIGQPGVEVEIEGEIATVVAWEPMPGVPGQYVGFTLEFSGEPDALAYDVAAGEQRYAGHELAWSSPEADDAAEPIEVIDFCDLDLCLLVPQLPFCPEPPECTDPEGCPPWGDGDPFGDDDDETDDETDEPTEPAVPECSDPAGCEPL